ncbi:hypothetical protein NM208_g3894 [Fusarium decemcellulare]|uniref:Uncharacterized protein n=1 Tax=Fusarium decemcellulare TaxID=57161 RepID=A0ACC1SMN2_9HYPO|nr:hypothetical protein NM208_g3894 [Fusarium decemcellulare]
MADQGDKNIETLGRINTQLRQAIQACFPCAYEQYVTIQIPGTIIDTRLGGSYLPKDRVTADIRNMIQCNESMLVDSMVPLDKVMLAKLGPTGKSVTRSYMTALDMLVPRKTEIGSLDTEPDLGNSDNTSKYSQAMKFLRSRETILTPNSAILGSRVLDAKDHFEAQGIPGTVVDRYVEKQLAWSEARGKWDAVRSQAQEARELGDAVQQSAAMFSARQKDLKRAQGELHARWMDWVVNGDKFRVEYCFSIVDRDSIMARIERGREATRDSLLTSINGTEWAQVALDPPHWAKLCRTKALDWKTRNQTNPAHLQLRLESLKRMKQAYEVYNQHLDNRSETKQAKATWDGTDKEFLELEDKIKKEDDASKKQSLEVKRDRLKPLWNALKDVKETTDAIVKTKDDIEKSQDATNTTLENELVKLEADLVRFNNVAAREEIAGGVRSTQEAARRDALATINNCESQIRQYAAADNKTEDDKTKQNEVQVQLDEAKEKWRKANVALQEIRTKETMASLEGDGLTTLKTSIAGQLTSINDEISDLQGKLSTSGIGGPTEAPSVILGVDNNNNLVKEGYESQKSQLNQDSSTAEEESADVWTKVAFSVGSKSDKVSVKESNLSASANVSVGNWFASVQANTSFSVSSKEVQSKMSSCTVDGSFSAMVVNIKRPWLHSDLFQDFDVDIPVDTKLSPGAHQIKEWVENGDSGTGVNKRTEYGKFPAYPTAFIVAADTVLEFKSNYQE